MGRYQVDVAPQAHRELRRLPGNMRQRVFRALRSLEREPRPSDSRLLDAAKAGLRPPESTSLHRIRLGPWRIVYVVEEDLERITVIAVRKRPPYQYDDLARIAANP